MTSFPPEAQPWLRGVKADISSRRQDVVRIKSENVAQQEKLKAGLGLLPSRIEEIRQRNAELPEPVSETFSTWVGTLDTTTPNTWTRVQDFTLRAPNGKSSVSIFSTVTAVIRTLNLDSAYSLGRLNIGGTYSPEFALIQTGFGAFGVDLEDVSEVEGFVEVYMTRPDLITDSTVTERANSVRTFTSAVWR